MDNVTRILDAMEDGDDKAAEQLLPLVYAELRRIAGHKMAGEREGHTLQATALVHEAYLRMTGKEGENRSWKNRKHFLATAAEAMRRVLIDQARGRKSQKRGGDRIQTTWNESKFGAAVPDDEVLAVDEALAKLEVAKPELAEIVKLRYFAGLKMEEIAASLDCSLSTVERGWRVARGWLFQEIENSQLDSQ